MGNCLPCRRIPNGNIADDIFNTSDFQGYTDFHFDAWRGRTERVIQRLQVRHFDFDKQTHDLNTPFALATHGNNLGVFDVLLACGANVNNADHEKDTPLHYATTNRSATMVKKLLEHGAKANVRNDYSVTPLWIAAYKKDAAIMKILLFYYADMYTCSDGAKVNIYQSPLYTQPRSPLYVAIHRNATECVHVLLKAGYDVHREKWLLEGDYPSEQLQTESEYDDSDDESIEVRIQEKNANNDMQKNIRLLNKIFSRPPSLLSLCRTYLRLHVGTNLKAYTEDFGLPRFLVDYLTLSEFDPKNDSSLNIES